MRQRSNLPFLIRINIMMKLSRLRVQDCGKKGGGSKLFTLKESDLEGILETK